MFHFIQYFRLLFKITRFAFGGAATLLQKNSILKYCQSRVFRITEMRFEWCIKVYTFEWRMSVLMGYVSAVSFTRLSACLQSTLRIMYKTLHMSEVYVCAYGLCLSCVITRLSACLRVSFTT